MNVIEMKKVRNAVTRNLKKNDALTALRGKGENIWNHLDSHSLIGVSETCHLEASLDCEKGVLTYGIVDRDSKNPDRLITMLNKTDLEPVSIKGNWAVLEEVVFSDTVKVDDVVNAVVYIVGALKGKNKKVVSDVKSVEDVLKEVAAAKKPVARKPAVKKTVAKK